MNLFIFVKKNFNAFTVLEMIAGMTISSIIIIAGFYILQLIQFQYNYISDTNSIAIQTQHLTNLVSTDFSESNTIIFTPDSILSFIYTNKTVSYLTNDTITIRQYKTSDHSYYDTFNIRSKFDNIDFIEVGRSQEIVKNCVFIVYPYNESIILNFFKSYSACTILQLQNEH
jgi:hypothetical protein